MFRIAKKPVAAAGYRFEVRHEDKEVGHAYLYMMWNDLHEQPFGLLEDVFVEEEHRGSGFGEALVRQIITFAEDNGFYKLIATSRHERERVHALYKRLGFAQHGLEFRMDF